MLLKTFRFNPGLPFKNGLFHFPIPSSNTKVVYLKKPAKVHNKRKEVKVVNIKLLGLL